MSISPEVSVLHNPQVFQEQVAKIINHVPKVHTHMSAEKIDEKRWEVFFIDEASLLAQDKRVQIAVVVGCIFLAVTIVFAVVGVGLWVTHNKGSITASGVSGVTGIGTTLAGTIKTVDKLFFENARKNSQHFFHRIKVLAKNEQDRFSLIKEIVEPLLQDLGVIDDGIELRTLKSLLGYRICYWVDQLGNLENEWLNNSDDKPSLESRMKGIFLRVAHDAMVLKTPNYIETYYEFSKDNQGAIDKGFAVYLNSMRSPAESTPLLS